MSSLGKRKARSEDDTLNSHGSTLFISNLPYSATSTDLQTLFSDIGPVRSGFVVLDPGSGVSKGVGYVSFAIKEDAQAAFDKMGKEAVILNGRKLRIQWADNKPTQKERKASEKTPKAALAESSLASEKPNGKNVKREENMPAPEKEETDEESIQDESDDSDEDEECISGDDEIPVKPQLPPPESGTTLFIRNIPFAATEDELRTLFRAYGPLRYVRITMDFDTGRSRGTGFACFWNKEHADKVIEQSELLREMTGDVQPMKNPFTLPSVLTPDPSSSLAQNLVLHGRTLDVVRAVTRDEAGKLKEEGAHRREKADKRNVYLLREGVILPNSPAASALLPIDLEKRTNSFNARRALLRSNPSLYLSKTRLSVRQIPLWVTERVLKRLALHAVKAFEQDVRDGKRAGLTADELAETVEDDKSGEGREDGKGKANKKKFLGRPTPVRQTKIIRQSGRVDPVTGKPRSKGYGFLEMQKHSDALRVLRWANNNVSLGPLMEEWRMEELGDLIKQEQDKPEKDRDGARLKRMQEEAGGSGKVRREEKGRLIVEFSIENVQVVKRRRERLSTADTPRSNPREKLTPDAEPVAKKRRTVESDAQIAAKSKKTGTSIGALIGRKRKKRKGKI